MDIPWALFRTGALVLFVALTLILVAGAARIPHMWVLSCLVLLTRIAQLVLHEVRRDRTLQERYASMLPPPGYASGRSEL